jgi:methylenetetrahydrofolate dehydrogenase (NADP+) / methenyltetrahydrofolate cyclohydrolase
VVLRLDGVEVRDAMVARIREDVSKRAATKVCLATVLVGEDGPSQIYVRNKHKLAEAAGFTSRNVVLPANATQSALNACVEELSADPNVHGILLQSPIPSHLNFEETVAIVPVEKDVDGLTTASLGRLVRGLPGHVSCTPLGVLRILQHYKIPTAGKRAVVIGRSTLVGLPMAILLQRKGIDATVTIAHSRTENLASVCADADILIAATGIPRMVDASFVKRGAVVVDVGISRVDEKIVGDVDSESVGKVASAVTPMPGGTGPMTVGCLIENTWAAYQWLKSGIEPKISID